MLVELRCEILRRTRKALADVDGVERTMQRDGPRVRVGLTGPSISRRREQAVGVRVLDAVRAAAGTFGQVDVIYSVPGDTDFRP
jgi:hypothetical protein